MNKIRTKERDTIIQSLRAGVVPRIGLRLIQVGRVHEIEAVVKNLDQVAAGGAMFRLVIGEYGSGKTFFLNLIKTVALEKKLVTVQADLSPNRRLFSTGGQARSLFAELMKSIATRTKPEGGALAGIIEKFISIARTEADQQNTAVESVIHAKLANLAELVNGYDFRTVILRYWEGFDSNSEQLKIDAVRWLRGEFTTKTEARSALGVRTIVNDSSIYDQLKLISQFVKLAGYQGLLICLDEMINLYKLANTQARNSNYEEILHILNDSLQGNLENMGFILGGTPDFLFDPRRGLYSYAALQSRLAENTFAKNGFVDYNHPVMRLTNLSPEEFLVLLQKLRAIFAFADPANYLLPDEALLAFMNHCNQNIGDAYFRTPRTTITAFINLLSILEQNPHADWKELINYVEIKADSGNQADLTGTALAGDDEFANFKL